MGCGLAKQNRVVMRSLSQEPPFSINLPAKFCDYDKRRSRLLRISSNSLLIVIDFLSFVELKEVGKVNRLFNYLSKQNEILIKFFKRKEIVAQTTQIDSFTVLKKKTSISCQSTSSDDL